MYSIASDYYNMLTRTMYNEYCQLDTLVGTLSEKQMYLPPETVCAMPAEFIMPIVRDNVRNFLEDDDCVLTTYATSSGGATEHKLFRGKNGKVYIVYFVVGRGYRVFNMNRPWLDKIFDGVEMCRLWMDNLFDDENNEPEIEDPECQLLESLTKELSTEQMTIPDGSVFPIPSIHYMKNARRIIRDFLDDKREKIAEYGYTSGGARIHKLFRDENGVVYNVFIYNPNIYRVYILTQYILDQLFEYEEDIPEIQIPETITAF